MNRSADSPPPVDVEACVRGNTGPAALTGALLMFFGFFWFGGASQSGTSLPQDATSTFALGNALFHWALRAGGLLMIAAAGWCSIGVPIALLVYALLAITVGCLLVLSAVLMAVGAGFAFLYPICVVCGAILLTYGVRDLRDHRAFPVAEDEETADSVEEEVGSFGEPVEDPPFLGPLPSAGEPKAEKRRARSTPARTSAGYLSEAAKRKRPHKH